MPYERLEKKLFSFGPLSRDLSLPHMIELDRRLGYPSKAFRAVHVAGTNGKGSVALKIATGLQRAGVKTGLFTSPHLISPRERIRVQGEEQPFERHLPQLFAIAEELPLSFFHVLTGLAFLIFAEEGVEVAVVEAGIGGRFDATNVVQSQLAVITSIGYDHRELLGESLEEIAWEKAGICKAGVPLVLGPTADLPVIRAEAEKWGCPVTVVRERGPHYDAENSRVAQVALQLMGVTKAVEVRPPCRFEVWEGERTVVLDVAHNADGLRALLQMLRGEFPGRKFRFVVGFSRSKEVDLCRAALAGWPVHCMGGDYSRLYTPSELSEAMGTREPEGIAAAWEKTEADEVLVVAGSFYIMGGVQQFLRSKGARATAHALASGSAPR